MHISDLALFGGQHVRSLFTRVWCDSGTPERYLRWFCALTRRFVAIYNGFVPPPTSSKHKLVTLFYSCANMCFEIVFWTAARRPNAVKLVMIFCLFISVSLVISSSSVSFFCCVRLVLVLCELRSCVLCCRACFGDSSWKAEPSLQDNAKTTLRRRAFEGQLFEYK